MAIDKYLVLNKYMLSLFGVSDFKDLQDSVKNANLGIDPNTGKTYFFESLTSNLEGIKLSYDDLERYDENIQYYVNCINVKREPKISLKYFQYLAILFSEIYFDRLKNDKNLLLVELNSFLEHYKVENSIDLISDFTEDDLNKIAFWMATGSGKTLISHINYYQFFKYELFEPDNIIFITPNEGLSKQHYDEMEKSGIPVKLYSGSLSTSTYKEREVLILEITKLVEEKKGGGVTVPVDAFEGKNLVFVDEGHKGKTSEEQKWSKLRKAISKNGFVFEYSATFGQILSEKNADTLQEYGKSIIKDYSYKYFYLDGYGKDFTVFNVKDANNIAEQEFKETVFVANLLSYYEQLIAYKENKNIVSEYNIEKPLWIFVGSTVVRDNSKEGEEMVSDILDITLFLRKALEERSWLEEKIQNILNGKTAFKDEEGKDSFSQKFSYLRERQIEINDLYKEVFGGRGQFQVFEIKNTEGELGLKAGEGNYFGVINIGDVSGFKKKLESKGIEIAQDVISQSLFGNIKEESSTINLLIGAKKFIEGWDTWRVSTMGLLNIGTGQGPQIIQLFGRGVRLKGKDMSLKRSSENIGNMFLKILETLQIYGIKANYIDKFLEAINKEVDLETIEIPVKFLHEDKWQSLYIPEKGDSNFRESSALKLEVNPIIRVVIDLTPKAVFYSGMNRTAKTPVEVAKVSSKSAKSFTFSEVENYLDLLDWDRIYREVNNFRLERRYFNIVLTKKNLKSVILSDNCYISSSTELDRVDTVDNINTLEELAILLLKKYLDKFYKRYEAEADMEVMKYKPLKEKEQELRRLFTKENKEVYIVELDRKENKTLIDNIKKLVNSEDWIESLAKQTQLQNLNFDRHLFVPLFVKTKEVEKIIPDALVPSEKDFLEGVKSYYDSNGDKFKNTELFVLRNFPSSGVGFSLEWANFYPDFVLWLKNSSKQMVVFIEPHGLVYSKNLEDDEKMNFREKLKEIEGEINGREKRQDIILEYFLITPTRYNDLVEGKKDPKDKSYFEKRHILFFEDRKWCDKMFEEIFSSFR